jgi:hypothetical protein
VRTLHPCEQQQPQRCMHVPPLCCSNPKCSMAPCNNNTPRLLPP